MKWIKCSDELPPFGQTVIVEGGVAVFGPEGWRSVTGIPYPGRIIEWRVSNWMPLPDPPSPDNP